MADEGIEHLVDRYLEEIEVFNKAIPTEADKLLEEKTGAIVYVGRETCPYCRRFVNKLSPLAEEHDLEINYLKSDHPKYQEEVDKFREKYDLPTVPALLYSSESAGLVAKCDSSLTKKEILEMLEAN